MKWLLIALALAALLILVLPPTVAARPPNFCTRHPSNPNCAPRTPSPTATSTATPGPTPTQRPTASPTATPSTTSSPTPSPTPSPTTPPESGEAWHFASIYHKRIADLDLAVAAGLNGVRIVNWLDESAGGNPYDETRWAVVDGLVAGAEARGLRILLDLSTYRNQLLAKGVNPYTVDWGPVLGFVAGRYAERIDLLALAGEAEPPNGGNPQRPTTAQLTAFYRTARQQWQAISSVPVESGGFLHYSWNSGIDWRAIFADMGFCSVHVYSQADIDFLPTIKSYCAGIGAPFFIEEFGQPQSVGDANRAAYFRAMFTRAADWGFWNLGPETVGGSHDVNSSHPLTWAAVQEQ